MSNELTVFLDAVQVRLAKAKQEVLGLCNGLRKWTMCVPAQPETDSDLVLMAALNDLARLERLLRLIVEGNCEDCRRKIFEQSP